MEEIKLIEFKNQLARLFEKHGISSLNALDNRAYIGFTSTLNNSNNVKDHFTFNYNFMGDANTIPLVYNDEELKKLLGISVYRGAYINDFIKDIVPLFKYYGVNSITSSKGGLYSLRWDDGNQFVMENVDLDTVLLLV